MPKLTFSLDNTKKSGNDFPRVKLEQGAVWRIVVIEKEPTYAWTHRLEKPRFSPVTGEMLKKVIERRNGEKLSVPDLEFVGAPTCFGDLQVLDEKGVDKDHCPVCAGAVKHPEWFKAPERRFAVHVLKYATKQGGEIASPFSVETRVWVMSENRFAKVTQVISEWGGDPTAVDLVLGPCVNAGFQNYEIAAGRECEWRKDKDRQQRAVETFRENNAGDLEPYCGRPVSLPLVQQDIDDVIAAWRKASSGPAVPVEADLSGTLDSSLLDSVGAAPAPAAEPLSALDATIGGEPEAPEEPAAVPAAAPAASKGEDISFDDLLNGLGAK